jgi:hypothetical protein
MIKKRKLFCLGVAACTMLSSAAQAAEDWDFELIPYLWMAGLSGEVGPEGSTANVHAGFDDLIGKAQFAFMGVFNATYKNDWTIFAEGMWLTLAQTATESVGPSGTNPRVDVDFAMASLAGAKHVSQNLEVYGGFRWLGTETSIDTRSPLGTFSDKEDWVDPFVGLRLRGEVNEMTSLRLFMDIGGLVNADSMFNVAAMIDYAFNETWSGVFGYRLLDVDYDEDGFVYDATMNGLVLGVGISF